jgi:4'-phosphopantetheinyl transferase EntD
MRAELTCDPGEGGGWSVRRPAIGPVAAPGVERLFEVPVAAFAMVDPGDVRTLGPSEAAVVAGAVPSRRSEFAAGRQCAHAALAECGLPPAPLLSRADRAPAWPPGVVGSITHTDGYALAVVARHPGGGGDVGAGPGGGAGVAIGVDAERLGRITDDLYGAICTAAEREWLEGHTDGDRRDRAATVLFGAKEAFYKAQRPSTDRWVGFTDVAVRPAGAGFELVPAATLAALDPWRWPVTVRWTTADDLVIVGITLQPAGSPGRPVAPDGDDGHV